LGCEEPAAPLLKEALYCDFQQGVKKLFDVGQRLRALGCANVREAAALEKFAPATSTRLKAAIGTPCPRTLRENSGRNQESAGTRTLIAPSLCFCANFSVTTQGGRTSKRRDEYK